MKVTRILAAALFATMVAMPAYAQAPADATPAPAVKPPVILNPGPANEAPEPQAAAEAPRAAAEGSGSETGPEEPGEASGTEAAAEPKGGGTESAQNEGMKSEDAAEDAAMAEGAAITAAEEKKAARAAEAAKVPTLYVNVDLAKQRMTVTENGQIKHTWAVSSGRYGYKTPTGKFKPVWMTKMWYSRQYDYAPMPHSIFFHGGAAIHATSAVGMLGRPASHGCIRLAPGNAAQLYKLVSKHGKNMTSISVHGTPDFSREIAQRDERRRYAQRYDRRGVSYYSAYGYDYAPSYRSRYAYADRYSYRAEPRRRYAAPRYYARPRGLFGGDGY